MDNADPVFIRLPWAPNTNNLYRNAGRRRVLTERYRKWREVARVAILMQRPAAIKGAFRASVVLHRPDRRRRDLDGCAKAVLDAIVDAGVVEDDSACVELTLKWADSAPRKPGGVTVELLGVSQ